MSNNDDINSLLSQLREIEKSKDYLNFGNIVDRRFDTKINDIIKKWISNNILSNVEIKFLDLYSSLQLSFVEYCLFNSDITENIQTMINKFPILLFKKPQTDTLANAVEFIRTQSLTNNSNEDDSILIYLMRLIDVRSLAYRLCFKNLSPPPDQLNDELRECLIHREAKNYLYDIKSNHEMNKNFSINSRHKFFLGCCTFAVALFDNNRQILNDNNRDKKYIYLLAKYIRIMLNKKNFEQDKSIIYCIRGIFALLTNCIPTENWIHIINTALANKDDENAQQENPFNAELFILIITNLLGSDYIQDKAIKSTSNEMTSLVDIVLIFLNKWCDTPTDINNDENSENDERNQVLRLLRSNPELHVAEIITSYIEAKYDRLRLMAVSTLSYIMNYEDFKELHKKKPNMAGDIIKLTFDFIDRAIIQEDRKYKGISFDRLLHFLLRFLDQDVFKKQMTPYISQIVHFAKDRHLYALKILRKISSSPDMKQDLLKNVQLDEFLKNEAYILFGSNSKMKKNIDLIRQNLAPDQPKEPQTPHDTNSRQAFISYCHRDKTLCDVLNQSLEQSKLFTNIWIDRHEMRDDMVDTITGAIRQSDIIFVLISDPYCQSDYCRREWTFAMQKKKKIYPIFVQEDFNRDAYDWVIFNIGSSYFYRIYKQEELQRLIKDLQKHLKINNEEQNQELKNNNNELQASAFLPIETQSNASETSRNISIAEWKSEDIQNWCLKNKLDKWCEPLKSYHGRALLELHKVLATDKHLERIASDYQLTFFDVVFFKSELDKLLSKPTPSDKPSKRRLVVKRRISKASVK